MVGFRLGKTFNMEDEFHERRGQKYELWRRKWKCILPLYHMMECPQCGAICIDGNAVYRHRNEHFEQEKREKELDGQLNAIGLALETICDRIGIKYGYESAGETEETGESDSYIM